MSNQCGVMTYNVNLCLCSLWTIKHVKIWGCTIATNDCCNIKDTVVSKIQTGVINKCQFVKMLLMYYRYSQEIGSLKNICTNSVMGSFFVSVWWCRKIIITSDHHMLMCFAINSVLLFLSTSWNQFPDQTTALRFINVSPVCINMAWMPFYGIIKAGWM